MFFPIGDTNIVSNKKPFITYILIAINITIFLFETSLSDYAQQNFIYTYGCVPDEIMYSENLYTLFTNIFLHAGWMHLIGNMVFLWVFGDNVEIVIGRFKFLIFYILGGVLASYMHCLFNQYSDIPCIGASGAIAACLGAYLVMFPKSKIKIFFILFFTSFRISAVLFLGIWILQQFMNGLGQFYTYTDNVAYWAHIGGFVYGTVIGIIVRNKKEMSDYILE